MTSPGGQAAGGASTYEVLAIRYGTRQSRASKVFLSFRTYGEPDRVLGMDSTCCGGVRERCVLREMSSGD